jgi:hypothetical protein
VSVPDTLDLAERAREAVHGLTSFLDDRYHFSGFGHGLFSINPPCLIHDDGQDQNWGKVMEALALAREMCGSQENIDRQVASLNGMISYAFLKKDEPYPVPLARMLMAVDVLHRSHPHPEFRRLVDRYRAWLTNRMHVDVAAGQAFFGRAEDRWTRDNRETPMGVLGHSEQVYTAGNVQRALVRASALSGEQSDRRLLHFLRNALIDPRYWQPDGHAGSVIPSQHGQFAGHHHSYTQALLGLLCFGARENDARTLEFVRQGYEFLRTFGIARIGLFGEGCTTGDMTCLAVLLSRCGVGDYWDDVDEYARNHLTELQILDTDRLQQVVSSEARPLAESELEEWAQGLDVNSVVGRSRGLFWSDGTHPTLIPLCEDANPHLSCLQWVVCCSANCVKALHEVWSSMLDWDAKARFARIHLLLNRGSSALDIHSYLPHEGKVVLQVKEARHVALRMPRWVDKRRVECTAANKQLQLSWLANYLLLRETRQGQVIVVRFPVPEATEDHVLPWALDKFWLESTQPPASWRGAPRTRFTLTLRGNTLADIQPRDRRSGFTLYTRRSPAHFRQPALMRRVIRFVAAERLFKRPEAAGRPSDG